MQFYLIGLTHVDRCNDINEFQLHPRKVVPT